MPPRNAKKPASRPGRSLSGGKPSGKKNTDKKSGGSYAGKSRPGKPVKRRRKAAPQPASELPGERLQKVLAAAGLASRREAETLILEGRVEVDGQMVTELGTRVDRRHQEIFVDGEPLPHPKLVYFAVNKPEGVVCTANDPSGRPRITDLLPPDIGRVFNVGRLDMSSEGLILMTNDGELANQLTHPRHGVQKIYDVQVAGEPGPEVLAQLRKGMHLAEGFARAVDVRVKSRKKNGTVLEMVLDEGRNREVRRLLARVGHKVQRLTRIAVGPVRLGEMPRGSYRQLTHEEVRKLKTASEDGPDERKSTSSGKPAKKLVTDQQAAQQRKRKAARGKASASRASSKPPRKGAGTQSQSGKKPSGKKSGPPKRGRR
ncbi:pseudouridine synthase [Bythopirellula goksoeyrii]|uniref:Pseudouridine synthase n=1 Tax=Bythopirellula goksoeyrii TaxID=1400387 RepID=A0A5B9Q536_9BACT|nr:pseudouridine synthase [Bythopirellula goksoeyrii]QEG32789.1 Ribosomal large subunit pseudouridine synthase B [Bythopirellula goksoeyrii]